jgi:hypothetical protein
MRFLADWKSRVIGCLALVALGVGFLAWTESRGFDAATARITQLVGEVAQQKGVASAWQRQYARAAAQQRVASDGVTVARTQWRTRTDTLLVHPVTKEDTARAIAQLPGVKAAGDALADSAAKLQAADSSLRQISDSTMAAKDGVIATQERLVIEQRSQIDRLRRGPRLSAIGQALYDPLARGYAVAVQGGVRIVGDWSVIARGEQRIEPGGGHLYVGLSHPLF